MKSLLKGAHFPLLKVCGITRLEDALVAVESGANALGFNFYPPSPRFISPLEAGEIIARVPAGILAFAVVVHPAVPGTGEQGFWPAEEDLPSSVGAIQVHGLERATDFPAFGRPVLVAVSLETAEEFADYDIIVDSSWGRGLVADWEKTGQLQRPYVLSGGLDPGNIEEALEKLNPAGIDVCSGVESEPGRKDPEKVRVFLRKALDYYGTGKR